MGNQRNSCVLLNLVTIFYYSYAACPPLLPTVTTHVTCKYNHEILENCITPMEGTQATFSCNLFYEDASILANPIRFCKGGNWDGPIPECSMICGNKSSKESLSQLNKQDDMFLEYPWHVGIYSKNQEFLCSGTLISMNLVLTVAHCVTLEQDFPITLMEGLLVASGKTYLEYSDKRDEFQQYSKVNKIERPEKYQRFLGYYEYNIAILVLTDAFLPSPVVQPVCISFNIIPSLLQENDGLVTGWEISEGEFQKTTVMYTPSNKCYSKVKYHSSTFDKICGNSENTTLCHDDRGGGLIFKNKFNNRYYIVGISVLNRLSTTCQIVNGYNTYTSLAKHRAFLEHMITDQQIIPNCQLPSFPRHGNYTFINKSDRLAYKPGYLVPPFSMLTLICNVGYNFSLPNETQFYCTKTGLWTPTPGNCTRIPQFAVNEIQSSDKPADLKYIYIIIVVAVVVLFIVAVITGILLKRELKKDKELRRELKLSGLDSFQYGDLKRFNPELGIDDQAEFLPYNSNYEFPRDKLKLGKQLGSGAFAMVLQADACGIISKEVTTTVAVKMVKSVADHIHMRALISELKIMIHLGQHLNVINLLGACTQNITKKELLIIVEYCQFGNLYNYLLQNRHNYIDQIDSVTGNVNYAFEGKNVTAVSNNERKSQVSELQDPALNNVKNSVSKNCNNIQFECKPVHCRDSKEAIKPLYTKDLISWSFQIASGMEYLSSRKIIHGDLAARNILLAEDNVVKISDFGLAKRMIRSNNYQQNKNKDCPLPFKWMAIKSIRDLVFSVHSDVWSYGIVLWELFSLAQTPYPGMEADEKLYRKLLDGYQMESPPLAPKEMYKIMCDCWSIDPLSRPSFNKLVGRVGLLLEENMRQHYIDLNDPYFVINTKRFKDEEKDYLAMLNPPDVIGTPGYLSMKPIYLQIDIEKRISNTDSIAL